MSTLMIDKMLRMNTRIDIMEHNVNNLKKRVDNLDAKVDKIDNTLNEIKDKIINIKEVTPVVYEWSLMSILALCGGLFLVGYLIVLLDKFVK